MHGQAYAKDDYRFPWHRIINSQGKISLRTGTEGVPEGKVDLIKYRWVAPTYGQIAGLAGKCTARQVGYAMAALRDDTGIPWHWR